MVESDQLENGSAGKAPGSSSGQQADLEPAMGPAAERQTVSWA